MYGIHKWLGILLAVALVGAAASPGWAGPLAADQRMKILMRVLAYDRQLAARQEGGKIFVAVLFSARDKASVAEKVEVLKALEALKALKVKGFDLDFAAVPYTDLAGLKAALGARRVAALYVCDGLASAIGDLKGFAAQGKIAAMSASEEYTRGGLAFAAVEKAGKGQIVVNLKSAKDEGLDLDAALLRLAVVLR